MSTPTRPALTVQALHDTLDQWLRQGLGSTELEIKLSPLAGGLGGSKSVPLSGAFQGIDWDNGRLLLHPSEALDVSKTDIGKELHKNKEALTWLMFALRKSQDPEVIAAVENAARRSGHRSPFPAKEESAGPKPPKA